MKKILITGANQGIGFETAKQLALLGHYVYLGSRDKIKGADAVNKLKGMGITNVALIEIDVTDIHSVNNARQALENKTGILDVLINNAAISGDQPQDIAAGEIKNLKQVFEVNFFGAVQTTQQFIPLLEKADAPVIVNVSSEMGSLAVQSHTANPNRGLYDAYTCSKAALNAFTVTLANAFKNTRFKINSVTPGYTATNLNQYKGRQSAEEAAEVIVQYALPDPDGPTGKFFSKNGEVPW